MATLSLRPRSFSEVPAWALSHSVEDRCDGPEFDKCEIGRDAYPHGHRGLGIGSIIVAIAWLAFCGIIVVQALAPAFGIETHDRPC
jgi:hypothetical protein